jgi:glycosyltransferase involved in cell wall biosynthesis
MVEFLLKILVAFSNKTMSNNAQTFSETFDEPVFTVVIPTFNRGYHIVPTVESVLDQTFRNFELIVVGDGVTDNTLESVPQRDSRVKTINLSENSGSQSSPNNAGIAAARGRYIAYLGHDDVWMPDHLSVLAEVFAKDECDVAISGCVFHGPEGTDLIWVTGLFTEPDDVRRHFFPPTALAHRASLTRKIGEWREPFTVSAPVDSEFILRAVDGGAKFSASGQITAHKFAAGHRYLSYFEHASKEQWEMLHAIRTGKINRRSCGDYIERARSAGTFMIVRHPDFSLYPVGDLYRMNRSNKGIERAPPTKLIDQLYVPQSKEPRALDWGPAELLPDGVTVLRRSGPSRKPKLLISFTSNAPARLILHLVRNDTTNFFRRLQIRFNGSAVGHIARGDDDTVLIDCIVWLRPTASSILELIIPESTNAGPASVVLRGYTILPNQTLWKRLRYSAKKIALTMRSVFAFVRIKLRSFLGGLAPILERECSHASYLRRGNDRDTGLRLKSSRGQTPGPPPPPPTHSRK